VDIGWDGKLQEDAKCIFEMEFEDTAEFEDDDEKYYSMVSGSSLILVVHCPFFKGCSSRGLVREMI
jgi:hypothetical protein